MATILAYTVPAAGHLFPLMPGLLELKRRGHEIHVRTQAELVDAVRDAGLHAEAVDPAILDVPVEDYRAKRDIDRLRRGIHEMIARGPAERADTVRAIAEVRPDALIIDVNAYGAAVAAQGSGLPWAISLPSLLALPGKGIPPYGLGMKPMRGPLGRVRDTLVTHILIRQYARAMLPGLNRLRAAEGLPELTTPVGHMLSADRLLVLTGDPLEYPRGDDLPPHVRFVGAQSWDPPAEVPAWLDEPGDPWVLVTNSTDYQRDEALPLAAVEALRDEPVRVILTLADAYDTVELTPAPNVRVERFVAHGPVLERAAAVVTHSGMGIVQKAVAAGVPIVAVPFGRDQPEVARRVVEAGAGVRLPARKLTPERLRTAVREALAMRPAAQAAGARLRAAGGASRFADVAEELAGEPAPAALSVAGAAA
jgi:MGT family glycosyltransferase